MKYLAVLFVLLPLNMFAAIETPHPDESLKGVPIDRYYFDGAFSILAAGLDWMSNQHFALLIGIIIIIVMNIYIIVQLKKSR